MKAKTYRTKPGHVNYDDLEVIKRVEDACEAIQTGEVKNIMEASKLFTQIEKQASTWRHHGVAWASYRHEA
ncbi:hypothetical protein CPB83DRAFT_863933 [Crepidotus variabilis]|uniref:Uncharacterized protein n=1 Tax=Crepidotus variabilis TaxID=179855 RepID=A0A9P6E5C6_9AGAR|nr:hypothetical protein CPB83DRAFT_863933 [Crepidotus variabilis]